MITYTKAEIENKLDVVLDKVKQGRIFIHPTDTIYGIGCDATNDNAVKNLRDIKNNSKRPFSIMAPSKTWIRDNCVVDEKVIEWLKKLPGAYTLILKLKNKNAVSKEVNNGLDTIGVRIPDHWFHELCSNMDRPIVTTSANRTNGYFMTSTDNLDDEIKSKLDFIVYEDEKKAKPSTIIDLTKETESIRER